MTGTKTIQTWRLTSCCDNTSEVLTTHFNFEEGSVGYGSSVYITPVNGNPPCWEVIELVDFQSGLQTITQNIFCGMCRL